MRCYILDNDNGLSHAGFSHILWNTAGKSTTILQPSFAGGFRRISPWFSLLHQATMPQDLEMFYHDLQTQVHADIRGRGGIQHNVANLL
tara:strand:+ start:117 stop:383 length:267 start_codon:yes stop_codon:yes gene_type:complete